MLQRLSIKNVALIDSANIEFCGGLNVLSGEPGAGKSVILDSVNFVLGAKADRSMIRYGESECLVKAEFSVPENSRAISVLREMDIDSDGEIIISRKFSENGKNTIKINGESVTATMLRSLTDNLVDVHGQSEHYFLIKESNQLRTLDEVIGPDIHTLKSDLADLLKERKGLEEQIALLGGNEQERNRRLELLKYQIDEITLADLEEDEEEALLSKKNKINNLEKIILAIKGALGVLSDDKGALDGLRFAKRFLSPIAGLDEKYEKILDELENLCATADDIAQSLEDCSEDLYFDENEALEIENRLDLIRDLKRKYGVSIQEINNYLQNIMQEYELLSDCEGKYAILTEKREKLETKIYNLCVKLTTLRKTKGKEFCERVIKELKTLNINSANFQIEFKEYSKADAKKANANGLDEICFMFSANAGEPLKPLGKIISGGEMSRFMLAIKTQLSSLNDICTYIFDEIDAGISGKTARVVGEKFAEISKRTQIIAVSHLAQIASMSDKEFLIEKSENNQKTLTKVLELDEISKTKEIVRLLGGNEQDEFAQKHAQELLKQAEEYKKSL